MTETHEGGCFCGAVRIRTTGVPLEMGYCHCGSCRAYSGGPFVGYALWPSDAVTVTSGAGHVAGFSKTGMTDRQHCALCGGHVMNRHPQIGLTDIRPGALPTLAFRPSVHLNYAETVMPVRDGLPKLRDFPAEAGGTGETLPE